MNYLERRAPRICGWARALRSDSTRRSFPARTRHLPLSTSTPPTRGLPCSRSPLHLSAQSRSVWRETGPAECPTVLQAIIARLSAQGPLAHEVWLPPLSAPPALDAVLHGFEPTAALTAPIGIVDRPFEQRRTPLVVDLAAAAGNVALVGAPQSGKSTALRTLITALAVTTTRDSCSSTASISAAVRWRRCASGRTSVPLQGARISSEYATPSPDSKPSFDHARRFFVSTASNPWRTTGGSRPRAIHAVTDSAMSF